MKLLSYIKIIVAKILEILIFIKFSRKEKKEWQKEKQRRGAKTKEYLAEQQKKLKQ